MAMSTIRLFAITHTTIGIRDGDMRMRGCNTTSLEGLPFPNDEFDFM